MRRPSQAHRRRQHGEHLEFHSRRDFSGCSRPPLPSTRTDSLVREIQQQSGDRASENVELAVLQRNLCDGELTHQPDLLSGSPTMMCDLSGRLFNVPSLTLGERVKRRIVRKLPMLRPAPANPPTPSRDLTTHVGTSLERRAPRQRTFRVRPDRVISVSNHVWVSMD